MSNEREGQLVVQTRRKARLARPPMYRVLLHNDDFTPRDFVVLVLQRVFHLGESEATRIMVYVHTHGVGVVGIYPFAVAETKVAEVRALAESAQYPLECTLEPENDGEGSGGDKNE